jgi:hypothetical protein
MFQKLSNSWELVKTSAQVLKADKELMIFPLISALALIVVSVVFFLPVTFLAGDLASEGGGIVGYVILFLFYVVQYSVIFFFNSALVGATMIRLDGGDPTVADGLRIARERLPSILGYALIAATVGMVLQIAKERAGFLTKIVISMVGMAWNLATYLVVPVLVTHDLSPLDAIRESAKVLKKTWGEQIAGNVGIGMVFGVGFVLLALLFIPAIILVGMTGSGFLIFAVIALFVLAFLALGLLNATLSGIYSAALYRFATQGDAGMFDSQQLQSAFRPV